MDKTENDSSSSGEEVMEEADNQVYCALCKTGFSGTVPYRQHLKGAKHTKAETKKFMKEKYGEKYLDALGKLNNSSVDEDAKESAVKEDADELCYTCHVCQKVCTGILPYKLHLASQRHAKQVRKQDLINKLKQDKNISQGMKIDDHVYDIVPQLKPFATCNVCGTPFSGPESYNQHMNGTAHKKEVQKHELMKEMEHNGLKMDKVGDGGIDEDRQCFSCADCGKSFSGPIPYQHHLMSEVHKNKAVDLELTEKVKHMMATDEEGMIHCAECGKEFSGPKPLYQHLNGPAHSKQKKKKDLVKDLLGKYPEFFKDNNKPEDEGDDSDSDVEFLICTICHKSFSGPESARDHFRSKKHLKAKKEKDLVEKIKREKRSTKKGQSVPDSPLTATSSGAEIRKAKPANGTKVANDLYSTYDDFELI